MNAAPRFRLGAALFALLPLLAPTVRSAVLTLRAELLGQQEVPVNTSTAIGRAVVQYDTSTKAYSATITVSGLLSALTGSHIHVGNAGGNGPVVTDFGAAAAYAVTAAGGFYAGTFTGTFGGDVGALLAAGTYVNVHSTRFPGGEIRGQLFLENTTSERLLNYSARGFVNPGNGRAGTLYGGFVLGGEKRVLLRSLGESLAQFGLNNGLKDVSIFVYDGSGKEIAANDDWRADGQEYAVRATGLAPGRDTDAALIRTLPAGSYTVQVDSEKGAGIAVLEVYGLEKEPPLTLLQRTGRFTTFRAAVQAAGLEATLNGSGPFTIFAPTDAAFAALGTATVQNLLLPANKAQLTALLLHHVVAANFDASQLQTGTLTMLAGTNSITATPAGIRIGTANVIESDLTATNGTLHIIDKVLTP